MITGYKGFIGQNMTKALSNHNLYFYEWNEPFDINIIQKLDWIIHLGAISSTTETDVEKIYKQNVEFTFYLGNLCKNYNVNLQYASSASVYGTNVNFAEDAPKSPQSPYAWSKYFVDKHMEKLINDNPDIIVQGFRYFNVHGPHEDHKGDQASPYHKFEKQAIGTGVIKIFENSQNYKRDFVHVHHVCEIHKAMLKKNVSGIFNVGMGRAKSFVEVAEEIANKYNAKIEYVPMPENIKRQYQTYTCADMTRLNSVL